MAALRRRLILVLLRADFDGLAHRQRQLLLLRLGGLVGADNPLHQRVAHHVAVFKVAEVDALHAVQNVDRVQQAGLARIGQIDLRDVAGDDGLGVVRPCG